MVYPCILEPEIITQSKVQSIESVAKVKLLINPHVNNFEW
jgi:hypothetical protein